MKVDICFSLPKNTTLTQTTSMFYWIARRVIKYYEMHSWTLKDDVYV